MLYKTIDILKFLLKQRIINDSLINDISKISQIKKKYFYINIIF